MLAGQINLLKERAVAVAQLVRSLKAEIESLKQELLTAQSKIDSLTNEIAILRISSTNPVYTSPLYREPGFRNSASGASVSDDLRPRSGLSHETAIPAPEDRQTSDINTESTDTANSFFNAPDDTQACPTKPQTAAPFDTEPGTFRDFDPFFDTFSRFESDDTSENTDAEFEFSSAENETADPFTRQADLTAETACSSEIKETASFSNRNPETSAPDKQPYSQLDIFY